MTNRKHEIYSKTQEVLINMNDKENANLRIINISNNKGNDRYTKLRVIINNPMRKHPKIF